MMVLEFITASYVAAFELACDGDIAMARDAGGGLHVVGFLPTRDPELSWHRPLNRSGRSVSLQTRTVVAIAALVLGGVLSDRHARLPSRGQFCELSGFRQVRALEARYRSTASAARLLKELNSSRKGRVNSAGSFARRGRTRTVIVTSVSSTTHIFHFRPLHSIVGLCSCMSDTCSIPRAT